jgi:hypothetical protein
MLVGGWSSFTVEGFGPYAVIFMHVCAVITVAMVMLSRDFGSYGIIFMTACVYCCKFSRYFDGQLSSIFHKSGDNLLLNSVYQNCNAHNHFVCPVIFALLL